eukprot:scaffold19533_cov40-Phaeocystis_antarctica.AAC.1
MRGRVRDGRRPGIWVWPLLGASRLSGAVTVGDLALIGQPGPRPAPHSTLAHEARTSEVQPRTGQNRAPDPAPRKSCVRQWAVRLETSQQMQHQLEYKASLVGGIVYRTKVKGDEHSARPHPLEHPLPLARELVRRAQELAHPLHHCAQLGGARGRAVGLRVPQPRGDRLGLEGVLVLRPPPYARVGHQRAQLLLRLGPPPLRQPQLDQVVLVHATVAVLLPEPRHRLDQQRLGLRQLDRQTVSMFVGGAGGGENGRDR